MHFAGLPWSSLLPLFAGVSAIAFVLYILKLRRRAVPVPFARIWDRVLRDKESSELFSQLKRWLSLLLQIALLAALVLALGDPRVGQETPKGRNVVLLIDASLSMQAKDVKPSRLELAKLEAKRFVRGLGSDDRAVVVQMDMLPTPLSTLSGEPSELEAAIERVHAEDTRADLARALGFAEDSLRGLPQPEIVLVSDGALGSTEGISSRVPVRLIAVGKGDTNLALTEFAARRYPLDKSRVEVMLEVTNTNDRPADAEVTLLGDGVVIDVTRLRLGPNERLPRFYSDIAGASRRLEARVTLAGNRADDLPADDRAYALMPERRRARVLVVTRGNTYLEAALLLDEYLDVTYVEPGGYPPKERFDVTIFDGVAPALARNTGAALYLNPPREGSPVKLEKPIQGFGFDRWNRKSPILRFLSLGDIQVAHGQRLAPEKGDEVIGESDLGPILISGSRNGQRIVVLGFDPRDSDFVLRPAWPLFALGTIDAFLDEDTSYLSSYRTGAGWRIPAPSGAETAELITPKGEKVIVPVKEGRAAYFGNTAGFYRLRSLGGEPSEHEFAANVTDPEESHIKPQPKLSLGGKATESASFGTPGVRHRFWAYLLLFVALASIVEWFTYHRRVTV
ncbi:MAG TPA: VWA domain-containing protein [Polyangiaceae bacterium]|nr:VWA domain-containing protein [Polyangiaceae bacterium]